MESALAEFHIENLKNILPQKNYYKDGFKEFRSLSFSPIVGNQNE